MLLRLRSHVLGLLIKTNSDVIKFISSEYYLLFTGIPLALNALGSDTRGFCMGHLVSKLPAYFLINDLTALLEDDIVNSFFPGLALASCTPIEKARVGGFLTPHRCHFQPFD
jgi:hypothetical protein